MALFFVFEVDARLVVGGTTDEDSLMGGWMTYGRVRDRNHLKRKSDDDPDPYWREGEGYEAMRALIAGDLNRMERDYLDPKYPAYPYATRPEGSDPAAECSARTGVGIEDVRAVLHYVFRESH